MQVEQMEQYLKWRGGIARGCVRNYKHRCEWRTELGITGRELERWTGARLGRPLEAWMQILGFVLSVCNSELFKAFSSVQSLSRVRLFVTP